jgi:hypothetical protein
MAHRIIFNELYLYQVEPHYCMTDYGPGIVTCLEYSPSWKGKVRYGIELEDKKRFSYCPIFVWEDYVQGYPPTPEAR